MKLLYTLLSIFYFSLSVSAQTNRSESLYLFDNFQETIVLYKDGRQFAVPLNFNLTTGRYVFIDKADGLEKEFSDPHLVALLKVGTRNFLMTENKATEIIQAEPKFYVTYTAQMKKAPSAISYGGTSETASVDSYTRRVGDGVQADKRIVANVIKTYDVQLGKKSKSFYNKRSFLRLFPKSIRAILEPHIEERETDFHSVEQVFELYQFAITL